MDKLGKQLAQLIKLLEEKVPQGFTELVKEYQYRMIWELVTLTVFAVILLIVAIISARYIIHNQEDKAKADCFLIATAALIISAIFFVGIIFIGIIPTGANMVSPAYSLLESLLQ